ncbi:MAG: hypothetical protein U0228_05215 [Myxococcaceae bacterium]
MNSRQRAAEARTSTDVAVLRERSVDSEASVREAAYVNPALPPDWKRLLERAGAFVEPLVEEVGEAWTDWNGAEVSRAPTEVRRASIPPDPTLTAAELEPLLALGPFARQLVASHPGASSEQFERLVDDTSADVVRALAKATRSADLLDRLARNPRADYAVANSPFAGPATLARLGASTNEYVRAGVAAHRSTPPDVLEALAADTSSKVLEALAGNRAAPPTALANIPSLPLVREALVNNPSAPPDVRERVLLEMARSTDWLTRSAAGSCRLALPASVVAVLRADASARVRESLATHRALSAELFEALATDASPAVRRAVVENPACPDALHRRLREDPDSNVRAGWRERPGRT